jgi:hypothetical protein
MTSLTDPAKSVQSFLVVKLRMSKHSVLTVASQQLTGYQAQLLLYHVDKFELFYSSTAFPETCQ